MILEILLLMFDRKVLTIEDSKYQFSGEIFEYNCNIEANDEHELIQKIGDFLVAIPKYMWSLRS